MPTTNSSSVNPFSRRTYTIDTPGFKHLAFSASTNEPVEMRTPLGYAENGWRLPTAREAMAFRLAMGGKDHTNKPQFTSTMAYTFMERENEFYTAIDDQSGEILSRFWEGYNQVRTSGRWIKSAIHTGYVRNAIKRAKHKKGTDAGRIFRVDFEKYGYPLGDKHLPIEITANNSFYLETPRTYSTHPAVIAVLGTNLAKLCAKHKPDHNEVFSDPDFPLPLTLDPDSDPYVSRLSMQDCIKLGLRESAYNHTDIRPVILGDGYMGDIWLNHSILRKAHARLVREK